MEYSCTKRKGPYTNVRKNTIKTQSCLITAFLSFFPPGDSGSGLCRVDRKELPADTLGSEPACRHTGTLIFLSCGHVNYDCVKWLERSYLLTCLGLNLPAAPRVRIAERPFLPGVRTAKRPFLPLELGLQRGHFCYDMAKHRDYKYKLMKNVVTVFCHMVDLSTCLGLNLPAATEVAQFSSACVLAVHCG